MKSTADVVIAGGGCMGCSIAWHLAQRGITNVVLLERESQLGTGSTGRNAGGFRHQFSNSANIELSIESIAMMANVSRETVSRALQALIKAGIIQKDTKRIVIQDPSLLEKLAKGEIDVGQLKVNRS